MTHLALDCNLTSPLHHLGVEAQPLGHSQCIGEAPLTPQEPVGGLQCRQIKLHTRIDEAWVRRLDAEHTLLLSLLRHAFRSVCRCQRYQNQYNARTTTRMRRAPPAATMVMMITVVMIVSMIIGTCASISYVGVRPVLSKGCSRPTRPEIRISMDKKSSKRLVRKSSANR